MKTQNKNEYKRAIYSVAHTDIGQMPFNNHGRTLRVVVESNVKAHALTIRLSNKCGAALLRVGAASIALCDAKGTLLPDTLVPLTVNSHLAFDLPAGEDMLSDTIPFSLSVGDHFALNFYYPTDTRVQSGNWSGAESLRSRPGNYSADSHFNVNTPGLVARLARTVVTADITVTTTTVSEVIAHCDYPGRVVGCFGDSITQLSNWTHPFTKLLHHVYPGEISLCNLGIWGNRLLGGSPPLNGQLNGVAGVERFESDLLSLPGLTHAIIALGTNDIGLPGSAGLPDSELISLDDYITTLTDMAKKLHDKNVKVYVATLCPRPYTHPYNEEREVLRRQMNDWIMSADCFDAVIDFDAVLRRSDDHPGMQDGYALTDGVHPSVLGGTMMAKSIDLSLFAEDAYG